MRRADLCPPLSQGAGRGTGGRADEIRFWTSAVSRCPLLVVGRLIACSTAVAAEEVVTSQSDRRIDRPPAWVVQAAHEQARSGFVTVREPLTLEADKQLQVAADLRELAAELQALAGQLDPPATT